MALLDGRGLGYPVATHRPPYGPRRGGTPGTRFWGRVPSLLCADAALPRLAQAVRVEPLAVFQTYCAICSEKVCQAA